MSVVYYYFKLVGYWNELDGVAKHYFCHCGKCECKNLWSNMIKEAEEKKTHQFLTGLNDEKYGTLRGHILAMDPLPDLDRIYNLVRQEEHHKRYMIDRESKSEVAEALAINRKHPSRTGERPLCTHCGKTGHEEFGCYEIIDYPSHLSNRGRG